MKLKGTPEAWQARLDALTQSEAVKAPDAARLAAAQDLFAAATAEAQTPRATESFLGAARRLWDSRGTKGVPSFAAKIASQGVEPHRERLLSASKDDLTEIVDQLALLCLDAKDGTAPLDRLLDLKAILSAGQDVAKAYRKRRKTTPAAQRVGAPLDERWTEILQTLDERLGEVARAERLATFGESLGRASTRVGRWSRAAHVDAAARTAGSIAAGIYGAGGKIADLTRAALGNKGGDIKVPGWVKAVAKQAKALFDKIMPGPVRDAIDGLTKGAHGLVTALYRVEEDAGSADALVDRFVDGLATAKPVVDPSADAVAIGVLKEAAVLLNGARGQELIYNRRTNQLQLNALDLVGVRLGLGATVRAFCRNLYGDGAAIAKSQGRAGLEVGAFIGHVGFFTAQVPDLPADEAPRGWMSTVSLGYTLSLPAISDQSLFALRERPTATFALTPDQQARIEAVFKDIPANASTYTDALGEAVKGADN